MTTLRAGVASEPLRVRCCAWTIERGAYLVPVGRPTPSRVLVLTPSRGIHKLKASTYRRVVRAALPGRAA